MQDLNNIGFKVYPDSVYDLEFKIELNVTRKV